MGSKSQEKKFVGREEESKQYMELLDRFLQDCTGKEGQIISPGVSSVFNVYGIGGVGKTRLLRHFADKTVEQKARDSAVQCIYIDTSGYNNYIEVLHTIRKNLKSVQKKPKDFSNLFFEFDTVYTLFYDSKSVEETDETPLIKLLLSQVLSGLPVGSMAAAVIGALQSGTPISTASAGIAVITAILDNLPGLIPEIWKKHRRTVDETRVRKQLEEINKNLGSEYERQRYMLSSFIKAAREISDLNPTVIMLDNLQAEGDYGRLLRDYSWLTGNQGLIASLPALYVLGGRDSVEYYLEPLIRKDKLRYNEKLELKGVTFEDICLFYQKQCGLVIEDSKVVYRMLNAAATEKAGEDDKIERKIAALEGKSFLPISMSMAADCYNQVKEQKERRGVKEPVTEEELGALDAEDQLSYFFELNLSEIKRDVFYMLSCIEVWEEKWFQMVKERFNNYLLSAVHVLRSFSSLESLDDNKVKIHDKVRESLYDSAHNQIKTDVEEWIFLYFLHMQNIYHAEGIRFAREPKVVEDLGELGVYAYVGMNYIEGIIKEIKKKEHERFTCESAMRHFQQAFSKSIILYASEERVNDQIIDILNFLANRTEKLLPDSEYEVEYRRRLTLMYSYSNKFSNARKESVKLLQTCQQRVDEAPAVGRSFSNYIQVCSDRNDAYNGLGYDYGDFWRYKEAAENGFLSVQEQYRLMREAEQYIWFDLMEEREAYEYLLDICAWGQYEWDEDELEENAAILKGSTYYKEREEGQNDGMIRRYLKARGNIPWYYLRLPEEERAKYAGFDPVRFGEQTYHLRKAFYGLDAFTLRSWHNVSVYLKGERRYEEALKVSDKVYDAAKKNLKNNEWAEKNLEQSEKKIASLKALGLIDAERIDKAFEGYKELLFYDSLILEILQYHSNYNLLVARETDDKEEKKECIECALREGEAAVVLRYICRRENDDALLTSWSYLASYYYARDNMEKKVSETALKIVSYVISKLEEKDSGAGNEKNERKLKEHKNMFREMKEGEWAESHRFAE